MKDRMSDSIGWLDRLAALCAKYEESLQPATFVNDDIRQLLAATDSPVDAVTLELQRKAPLDHIKLGKPGTGSPTEIETSELYSYVHCVSIWRKKHVPVDVEILRKQFLRLAAAHWKTNLHDRFGLLSFQYDKTKELLENTIAAARNRLYLLFTDLDRFKTVNDKYGQDGGDTAILQFGAVFDSAIRPDATPIHRSGDEYCAVIFSESPEEALRIAERVSDAVLKHEFIVKANKIKLGATIGLTAAPPGFHTYTDVEHLAVDAIKPSTGKQRGKIRFSVESGSVEQIETTPQAVLIALCLVKTNIPSPSPFASPVLNLLSQKIVAEGAHDPAGIQGLAEGILRSTTVDVVSNTVQSSIDHQSATDVSMRVSQIDVALAAAHGIFRSSLLTGSRLPHAEALVILRDTETSGIELQTKPPNQTILGFGKLSETPQALDLGAFATANGHISPPAGRRAVLIQIGHAILKLPAELFAEVIVVDDRPTRGGGLPDFWEATIARLTGVLQRDPNVQVVFVYGDTTFASLTAAKLKAVGDWERDVETLTLKTGMASKSILDAARRLAGHVIFVRDIDDLINRLTEVVREKIELKPLIDTRKQRDSAFLQRSLLETNIRLGLGDGCRVATITEAYPVVIEIIRKTEQAWNATDQAGVALRELTDFKVHLTDPSRDKVPAFYATESESLEEYFVREFLSETGTFGRVFHKSGQVEPVLRHVVSAISGGRVPATTRRGILIIPHEEPVSDELAPLGLVAVRIVPRISDRRVRFDYSFVWRTVEAMVGFPYSLFGSVRFSEYLTERLRQKLSGIEWLAELGELSYIAQSLHMFSDEYGQIIARRIVNDASL